ncbi:MAG: DUF559 domain-containing protein [Pseudomonadota bacterium]
MIKLSKEWAKKLKIKTPKIIKKKEISAEDQLWFQLQSLSGWERQHRFHPTRKWAFDFAHVEKKVAVEVEGGIWSNGRHTRGSGYLKDMEKYREAEKLGWTLLRYSTCEVKKYKAIADITDYIKTRGDVDV